MAARFIACLVLALWMTGSRLATGPRIGSPPSGSHWDQAYPGINATALRYRTSGDLRAAERVYQQGLGRAILRDDRLAIVRFLMSVGGCRLLRFEYRSALVAFLDARERAFAIDDTVDSGAIAVNISSIYLQMWDISSAQRAAEQGLDASAKVPGAYFVPQLLLQLGRLEAMQKSGRAESYYRRGIAAAARRTDRTTEAHGWDWLGEEQFARDALPDAEKSFLQAYNLRLAIHSAELGFSYARLGALRLAQGRLQEADRLTQLAVEAVRAGKLGWSDRLLRQQQGSIHLARGEVQAALEDYSQAIDATAEWRLSILPSRSSLTAANTGLEEKIYRSFIQLAADHAVQTHSSAWAMRAFQALELNRSASLRESLALADVWRERLPPEYWESVDRLESAQAKTLGTGHPDGSIPSLRLKITEMEARAGLGFAVKKDENIRIQTSLNHFQDGLGASEVLLTFFLGRDSSYLWAVSRESLHVYRLAPERKIAADAAAFREAAQRAATGGEVLASRHETVRAGGPAIISAKTVLARNTEAERQGRRLYQDLFGSLSPSERSRKSWFLSLEGVLFDVPFAALVEPGGGQTVYLVERHSIQTVPGALLLNEPARPTRQGGLFVGVGDPIYNAADPRWRSSPSPAAPAAPAAPGEAVAAEAPPETGVPVKAVPVKRAWAKDDAQATSPAAGQLVRLIASGDEVQASAASWQRQAGTATVLEGFQAGRDAFLDQLTRHPRVIHLATHVLFSPAPSPESSREQAFVAFSMPRGTAHEGPQYLTTARISTLQVPGALVVMTGCATGTGDARAGAGLLGLTRAWLMAGASGVLSTVWPVEDSPGEIFARFYRYYPEMPAAEALRKSQVEMLHRTAPSQWASYQLTGGLR